ncbi:hypothetical protein O6P43_006385 [Quillaja saponaria]|uniref:Uncharacterized protein n=1 Tax=Quillaja saponaria TaxID=32244 RepID=A0AAD7VIA6_QUISA|nr:hypothetical protein O6P43_006385 [Quillaja saponaria]
MDPNVKLVPDEGELLKNLEQYKCVVGKLFIFCDILKLHQERGYYIRIIVISWFKDMVIVIIWVKNMTPLPFKVIIIKIGLALILTEDPLHDIISF